MPALTAQVLANYDLCDACHRQALGDGAREADFARIAVATPVGAPPPRPRCACVGCPGHGSTSASGRCPRCGKYGLTGRKACCGMRSGRRAAVQPGRARASSPSRVSEPRPGRGRAESALRGHRDLLQWVWNYFTDEGHSGAGPPMETRGGNGRATQPGLRLCGDPVVVSRKPPLYFQHEGHSRTLVGVERRQRHAGQPAEVSLLILDPSQPTAPLVAALRERRQWQARLSQSGDHAGTARALSGGTYVAAAPAHAAACAVLP